MPQASSVDKASLVKISKLAAMSGVSTPTIKYYMTEGLLPGPALKTSRNMAWYDPVLAERVKVIKDLQSNHFFPLKMIGEILEPAPSANIRNDIDIEMRRRLGRMGEAIEQSTSASRFDRDSAAAGDVLSLGDVLKLEISKAELAILDKLGMTPETVDKNGERIYEGVGLDMVRIIHETREMGMGDIFPMEILEPYIESIGTLVERELSLFRERVLDGADLPDQPFDEVARNATALSERLVLAIRSQLLLREISKLMGGDSSQQ
jgi:DNA-binding transcriptional MerR regulator